MTEIAMKVPRDLSGKRDLLANRPGYWEYLLFAHGLLAGLDATEDKWRDFTLGYTMQQGARIPKSDLIDELNARLSRMQFIAGNIMKVISEDAQLRAFGAPGVSGDPDMIEHMAKRLIDLYEAILDWQSEVLALRLHAESTIPAIGASMARQPITAIRDFSYEFAANLEAGIARAVADPDSKVEISMTLTFLLDDGLVDQWIAEVKRLMAI